MWSTGGTASLLWNNRLAGGTDERARSALEVGAVHASLS